MRLAIFPFVAPWAILAHCRQSGQTESCHSSSLPHRMQLSSPFSQACQQPLHGRLRSISQSAAHRHRRYPKTCCRLPLLMPSSPSPHGPAPGFSKGLSDVLYFSAVCITGQCANLKRDGGIACHRPGPRRETHQTRPIIVVSLPSYARSQSMDKRDLLFAV